MILVDSSVWIDLMRGGVRPATEHLREWLDRTDELACCEPIGMELLAGAKGPDLPRVERLVDGLAQLSVDPAQDYRHAAGIFRRVRQSGHTVRSLNDCLIAAIAIRHDAVLLDEDRDFERIAAVTELRRWERRA